MSFVRVFLHGGQVAQVLVRQGVDVNATSAAGVRPVDVARDENMRRVLTGMPGKAIPNLPSRHMEACVDFVRETRTIELLEELTAMLLYHQPDDPKAFLIQQLEALRQAKPADRGAARLAEPAGLFSLADLDALFDVFDIEKKGVLSLAQYRQALADMGVTVFDREPALAPSGVMDKGTFLHLASRALADQAAQYASAAPDRSM